MLHDRPQEREGALRVTRLEALVRQEPQAPLTLARGKAPDLREDRGGLRLGRGSVHVAALLRRANHGG